MARKAANGEGTIVKNIRNGLQIGWRASITTDKLNSKGSPIRKQFTGKTQLEVKEKMNEYKKNISEVLPADQLITLEEWYEIWLFDYKIKDLKPKSLQKYTGIYNNYIKNSSIGKMKLIDIRATHVQRYINFIDEKHGPSIAISINTRLKPCLSDAERHGYIQKNWCKLVVLPKYNESKNIKVFTSTEQQLFIYNIKGHQLEELFLVALSTGLRLGELLGLKWSDIDFNSNTLTVNRTLQNSPIINKNAKTEYQLIEQTPKTKNSYRTLPIPTSILIKLKSLRIKQKENKLKIGDIYEDKDYVFTNDLGSPIDNKKPGRNLTSILKNMNMEHMKFHALRHTYATRLFEAGVPPKTVQVLMGHSDLETTMNIYTHVMEDTKLEAVKKLEEIFPM